MTTYLTEPYTDSNGAAWNSSNWSNLISTAGASATIQGNKGRQNAGTNTSSDGKRADRWSGSTHADYEAIGKFTIVNSVNGLIEIWLRASTTAVDGTGYFLQISSGGSNNFKIGKGVNYSYSTLVTSTQTVTVGVQYAFRFYAVGTTLKAKFWDPSGSEPGAYTITTTDSSVSAAGYAYLGCNGGTSASFQVDWDDITLTDGTGSALTFTGTSTTSGTFIKTSVTKNPFTGTIGSGLAGTLIKTKATVRAFTGTVTTTGAFAKVTNKLLKGTVTTTGQSLKKLFRTFTGSSTSTGFFRKAAVRTFTGTVTSVGVFANIFLGRIFGRSGVARVVVNRAAQALIRIRRT